MYTQIFIFITAVIFTILFFPLYKNILIRLGSVQNNYQKKQVPISFGAYIFIIETFLIIVFKIENTFYIWITFLIMTFVGLYDDLFGTTTIKGLKGHFTAFFRGQITSGFIKALSGGFIAFFLSIYLAKSWWNIISAFFLILLMINTVNLFDLRPGRALKLFFFLFTLLAITTSFLTKEPLAFILLGILIILFKNDIRAKIMIGDSGANLIGLHLGIWFSSYYPMHIQWIVVFLLVVLHIYTERYSLSELIERNRYLRKIDLWGRKGTM